MRANTKPTVARCGIFTLKEIFAPQVGDQLCVEEVRRIARNIPHIIELGINEVSKVISFQSVDSGWKINVYYTTGTVGTCVEHPISGKTQLFRRKVDYETLQSIFTNPRVHTGKGYYTAPVTGFKRNSSEISCLQEDEETALSNQIAVLKPQLVIMEEQLASIRQKRAEEAQKRAREEQELAKKKREAARLAEEERILAAATAEIAEIKATLEQMVAKKNQATISRTNNARGACFDYSLRRDNHMPASMKDVKCVAICGGGYVAVKDCGSCCWHGIPSNVIEVLERQHNRMIDYIALGPEQYYIRKTNGKILFGGCGEFEEEMRNNDNRVKFVTFGDEDSYYIEYESGKRSYSRSFESQIPSDVFDRLTSRRVSHFYLGQDAYCYFSCNQPYCITYENGTCEYDDLPSALSEWLDDDKKPGNKMKQVLADDTGCYFVRFT